MGFALHQHGHSHGSNSKHSHEESKNHSHEQNINVRAAFIHVIGDFIQSVGVLIAALIIYFKPTYLIVDPICTFIFSALVLLTTYHIVKDAVTVLMEGKPKEVDTDRVVGTFLNIDNVVRVHNLRIWALTLDKIALSAHLAIKPGSNPQLILAQASKNIRMEFNLFEITLQIEEFREDMENCTQCKMPDK